MGQVSGEHEAELRGQVRLFASEVVFVSTGLRDGSRARVRWVRGYRTTQFTPGKQRYTHHYRSIPSVLFLFGHSPGQRLDVTPLSHPLSTCSC